MFSHTWTLNIIVDVFIIAVNIDQKTNSTWLEMTILCSSNRKYLGKCAFIYTCLSFLLTELPLILL